MLYFSEFRVVPLLLLLNFVVNVTPSVEVLITKLYWRSLPLYHAMFTLQIFFLVEPRSASIHAPVFTLAHLVLRLLSRTFEGKCPSLPLSVTLDIGRLLQDNALA